MKVIELNKAGTAFNDRDSDILRKELKEKGVFLINLMSSAGSGKTTLLSRIITDLRDKVSIGVMEADIASDVDALAIESLGAESIQVHTGGACHMDAAMTREALEEFEKDIKASQKDGKMPSVIFLENVGNLICPAEFDTGAHRKMMILSLTEGDDKPLKYPLMFQESDALVITKTDAAAYFDFDIEAASRRAKTLNPSIRIFPVSAKRGDGMEALENWILDEWTVWKNA
jgi:hydrogenase nickel incorporation protein HypB